MKKTLSLILAALMCAAMTPAVMAEEVAETPAVVEEAAAEETVSDLILDNKATITITVDHIVALATAQGITVTAEEITALVGDAELTADFVAATLTSLGYTVTAEEVTAAVAEIAYPHEKYVVTSMSVNFFKMVADVLNMPFEEEAYAYLEDYTLTPALIAALYTELGAPITEAQVVDATFQAFYWIMAQYSAETAEETVAEETSVVEEEAVAVEEVVEEEAIVEEVIEEEVSKYPVILEETPTFGLFTKILSIFTFRG